MPSAHRDPVAHQAPLKPFVQPHSSVTKAPVCLVGEHCHSLSDGSWSVLCREGARTGRLGAHPRSPSGNHSLAEICLTLLSVDSCHYINVWGHKPETISLFF